MVAMIVIYNDSTGRDQRLEFCRYVMSASFSVNCLSR